MSLREVIEAARAKVWENTYAPPPEQWLCVNESHLAALGVTVEEALRRSPIYLDGMHVYADGEWHRCRLYGPWQRKGAGDEG